MANEQRPATPSPSLSKFVQNSPRSTAAEALPAGAVLADVLRTVETQLCERGLLGERKADCFHPLWYVAETERNVFLWKRGCSLIQHDEFEFWIDVPALIEKRLEQLEAFDADNPFLNPLWGVCTTNRDNAVREREYLLSFKEALGRIENHLHALSKLGSALLREQLSETDLPLERVLLPVAPSVPGMRR